jgi:hypothetical protein
VSAKKSGGRTSRPGSSSFPVAADPARVGQYPALTSSGAGHFYDEVLEYRVWVHPEKGGEDLHDGSDYFFAFATFDEALACSSSTAGAEEPLVLVRQDEHVDEPEPGRFVHEKGERIAEWRVEWLQGSKRTADSIRDFLKAKGTPA